MNALFNNVSPYPWVMVLATIAISLCLLVASHAEAETPAGGTTLSHCGWLQNTPYSDYRNNPRSVRIIQEKLEALGFSVGKTGIDGLYGKRTKKAVKEFQQRNHLHADGSMTSDTVNMLAYQTHPNSNVRRCKRPYAMLTH